MYTGRQALELGLVDKIGSLRTPSGTPPNAPADGLRVRSFPEPKNFLELFVEDLSDGEHDPNHVSLAAPALGASGRTSLLDLALPHLKGLTPAGWRRSKRPCDSSTCSARSGP